MELGFVQVGVSMIHKSHQIYSASQSFVRSSKRGDKISMGALFHKKTHYKVKFARSSRAGALPLVVCGATAIHRH